MSNILTFEEIDAVWGDAKFGGNDRTTVLESGILRFACGYVPGRTLTAICLNLNLIDADYTLTNKGKMYLWECFSVHI